MRNHSSACNFRLPWVLPYIFKRVILESPSSYLEVLLPPQALSETLKTRFDYTVFPDNHNIYDDVIVSVGEMPTLASTPIDPSELGSSQLDKYKYIRLDPKRNLAVGWKIRKGFWKNYYSVSSGTPQELEIYDQELEKDSPPIKRRLLLGLF